MPNSKYVFELPVAITDEQSERLDEVFADLISEKVSEENMRAELDFDFDIYVDKYSDLDKLNYIASTLLEENARKTFEQIFMGEPVVTNHIMGTNNENNL